MRSKTNDGSTETSRFFLSLHLSGRYKQQSWALVKRLIYKNSLQLSLSSDCQNAKNIRGTLWIDNLPFSAVALVWPLPFCALLPCALFLAWTSLSLLSFLLLSATCEYKKSSTSYPGASIRCLPSSGLVASVPIWLVLRAWLLHDSGWHQLNLMTAC